MFVVKNVKVKAFQNRKQALQNQKPRDTTAYTRMLRSTT